MTTEPIEAETIPETQAVALRQNSEIGLFGTQDPSAVIGKAKIVAQALKDVIVKQGLVSRIQGKEYPRCEAWTLLGTMLGVFPVLAWTKPVEGGWEARVEARTKDGAVIGAAEAQCLRAERNWQNRDDFALRSMAQTRATAKCLRMPLGFVMSLSGFEVTPAEEMVADHPAKPQPKPPSAPKPEAPKPAPCATEEQKARFLKAMEPARELAQEFFCKLDWLIPTETLEDLDLRYVPSTVREMKILQERLTEFGNGEQAGKPYEPHWGTEAKPIPQPVPRAAKAQPAKDDEGWRDVIIPVPPKGMSRDQYLKAPQTIGQLFDLRHGNDEEAQAARQRLWGFVNHYEAKPWVGKDGKERPPSDSDVKFREVLDQFAAWFQANHPDEKL